MLIIVNICELKKIIALPLNLFKFLETKMSKDQPNNPLHGIKLATMLEQLFLEYGWEELGDSLNINAFKNNPTYKSSLKFLRTTPWAREKVEQFYLKNMID